jgi:hypothetical protein
VWENEKVSVMIWILNAPYAKALLPDCGTVELIELSGRKLRH